MGRAITSSAGETAGQGFGWAWPLSWGRFRQWQRVGRVRRSTLPLRQCGTVEQRNSMKMTNGGAPPQSVAGAVSLVGAGCAKFWGKLIGARFRRREQSSWCARRPLRRAVGPSIRDQVARNERREAGVQVLEQHNGSGELEIGTGSFALAVGGHRLGERVE